MSARDELAQADELHSMVAELWGEYSSAKVADAILAAGYTKPRTITTAEELDALPGGTVIRDYTGVTWQRYAKVYDKPVWFAATRDTGFYFDSNIVVDGRLPATVLYEPTP